MDLSEILNKTVPNAGPQARAAIAEAERRLTMLDGTDPKRANILREQISQQISSRDEGVKFTLADIGKLHGSSLGRMEPDAKVSGEQDQTARSIEQLVSIADSRNIAIPPADLAAAANAFAFKDQSAISALANQINELVNSRIEVQDKETKEQRQFDDGSIAIVGSQSGSRYDNTGNIIPFGNQNAQIFRSVASEAYSPQSKEIIAAMGSGSDLVGASAIGAPMQKQPDIGVKPEAYAAMQKLPKPTLDPIERNTQANERARLLYEAGDRIGALNTLRALRAEDIYGDITDETLDSYFGKSSETVPKEDTRKPIGEIIPNKK